MTERLKDAVQRKIDHSVTKGDQRGSTLSGMQTIHARCVGYDRDRRIVIVINPFGEQSSISSSTDAISDVTIQIMQDYGFLNLVEVPWTPQSGNDNEVDPGEALEGYFMAGIRELSKSVTEVAMFSYLFYLRWQNELTLVEWMVANKMLHDAMNRDTFEGLIPPLRQCIVEIQFTQTNWPRKAKCIRVITYDSTEQGIYVHIPNGSDSIIPDPENSLPHDIVNLDRVVEDVDRFLEKMGSSSFNTTTSDRTLNDEIERRERAGYNSMARVTPTGAEFTSAGVQRGQKETVSETAREVNVGSVNRNIFEGDSAPLYKPFSTVNNISPYNVSRPGDSSSWGMKTDPQEPMLTMFKSYGLLSKKNSVLTTSIVSEKTVKNLALINPVRGSDIISILSEFGKNTLDATGTVINSPGIIIRVRHSAPAVSSGAGIVDSITQDKGISTIIIKHNEEVSTEYRGLLTESISVVPNQSISSGKIIGLVPAGFGNMAILTFVVTDNGANKDPMKYIPGWKL